MNKKKSFKKLKRSSRKSIKKSFKRLKRSSRKSIKKSFKKLKRSSSKLRKKTNRKKRVSKKVGGKMNYQIGGSVEEEANVSGGGDARTEASAEVLVDDAQPGADGGDKKYITIQSRIDRQEPGTLVEATKSDTIAQIESEFKKLKGIAKEIVLSLEGKAFLKDKTLSDQGIRPVTKSDTDKTTGGTGTPIIYYEIVNPQSEAIRTSEMGDVAPPSSTSGRPVVSSSAPGETPVSTTAVTSTGSQLTLDTATPRLSGSELSESGPPESEGLSNILTGAQKGTDGIIESLDNIAGAIENL